MRSVGLRGYVCINRYKPSLRGTELAKPLKPALRMNCYGLVFIIPLYNPQILIDFQLDQ